MYQILECSQFTFGQGLKFAKNEHKEKELLRFTLPSKCLCFAADSSSDVLLELTNPVKHVSYSKAYKGKHRYADAILDASDDRLSFSHNPQW